MILDPMYLILVGPAMLLALWAQFRVKSAYARGSQIAAGSRITGAQAAAMILRRAGIDNVAIEPHQGFLSDHYDPRHKVLRLSPDVYGGRSLAALGIAAHEAGHAIQDHVRYAPLALRNFIVPLAGFGSNAAFLIFMLGLILSAAPLGRMLMWGGVILFGAVVVFQLVNLPVEYDASNRARQVLAEMGLVSQDEAPVVKSVLSAAALTYVAATLTAIMTFVYMLLRAQGQRE